jgi:hypothetical protein
MLMAVDGANQDARELREFFDVQTGRRLYPPWPRPTALPRLVNARIGPKHRMRVYQRTFDASVRKGGELRVPSLCRDAAERYVDS